MPVCSAADYLTKSQDISLHVPGLSEPNVVQRDAIRGALRSPFFLIQGPPGTGKTAVAVRLTYLFVQLNKTLGLDYYRPGPNDCRIHPQVLCCGPSNKSADVIAGLSFCIIFMHMSP